METKKKQHFLVLVPHRDARIQLQKQSELLIKNGLSNVYPFPHAAVLASLSKPLNDDELKKTAKTIRETIGKEKIIIEEMTSIILPMNNKKMELFGYKINLINVLEDNSKKINKKYSSIIIGSFLIDRDLEQQTRLTAHEQSGECESRISFRAAAIANMYWKPVKINGETCYKWKIGKLFWLPHP